MNESVKAVLLNYAVCSLVGGILSHIAPEKMRKTLRVIITLFLISTIIFPLLRSEIKIDDLFNKEINLDENQYSSLLHMQNLLEEKLYGDVSKILINYGINEYEIYITTTADEVENIVFLDEIKIEVSKEFEYLQENIINDIPQEYKAVLKVGVKNEYSS